MSRYRLAPSPVQEIVLRDALFTCVACNFACNADVNAAKNIAAGHAVSAREGLPLGKPVNREPQPLAS